MYFLNSQLLAPAIEIASMILKVAASLIENEALFPVPNNFMMKVLVLAKCKSHSLQAIPFLLNTVGGTATVVLSVPLKNIISA
jgi:hypothetical protein